MKYNIQMKADDFFKIHNKIKSENVEIKDKQVTFNINMESYKTLKKSGYKFKIVDNLNNKIKGFFIRYYIVLIGILYVFSIIYIDSYRISGIKFNKETPINKEIEHIIKDNYKRLLWFDYCSLDYDELSIKLRQKYSSYPYINVYEQNNEIIVEIFNYDEKFNNEIKNIVGSVVAKKDAVVDLIYVYSGTSNVYKNKYVKKGDVLISENLTSDTKVSAKGLIMGYTYEMVNLSINKENKSYTITNNENVYHKVNFCSLGFNVGKGKNESFEFCDYEYEKIFNIYNLLTIERVTEKASRKYNWFGNCKSWSIKDCTRKIRSKQI